MNGIVICLTAAMQAGPAGAGALPLDPTTPADEADILVTGKRIVGSAVGEIAPVATLNAATIRTLGAVGMKELVERLKPLTMSAGRSTDRSICQWRRSAAPG